MFTILLYIYRGAVRINLSVIMRITVSTFGSEMCDNSISLISTVYTGVSSVCVCVSIINVFKFYTLGCTCYQNSWIYFRLFAWYYSFVPLSKSPSWSTVLVLLHLNYLTTF